MKSRFLIGALSSGSGKTTLTMGILRALSNRGLQVQPFKCGPDYIDTRFHEAATGRASVNLDTWLSSESHVRDLYARYGADADVCVTEGVMGLYDGYDRSSGSSAAIAQLTETPVVLVAGARSTSYTLAAQLWGMKHFRPGLQFAGVVFNQVGSARHERLLLQAAEDAGLPCLGTLPRLPELEIPSRHLGLQLADESEMKQRTERAAEIVERYVDLSDLLLRTRAEVPSPAAAKSAPMQSDSPLRIAVARDAAFNFIYPENLSRLAQVGQLLFFSPLAGEPLPEADLVYFPGGYPELYAKELAGQEDLKQQIREYAEAGGRILAECGGMIWLTKAIEGVDGSPAPMCGVLPFSATMEGARLHMGYRRIVDASGRVWRGHEFHYSQLTNPLALPSVAKQYNAAGDEVETPLYRYKNVIAGYTHFYWGESDILYLWK
ncbi:MAG: cobyrinate a,c-diamide synthase [Bacteroidales bacterium]|nr:cobyrinate a,c-diamide synthase [Bacteroidales bacterium]MBR0534048.1 cobyrinate a,c-diamide synthase [Bacteroidales bacterium]